jgi:hypothetical protein
MSGVGQSQVTAAWAFKYAFYQEALALQEAGELAAGTYICLGDPSSYDMPNLIQFGAVRTTQAPANMSAANRPREETLELSITIEAFQGGMDDAEIAVQNTAYGILQALEKQTHYIQGGTDGSILGGVVRQCFLTTVEEDTAQVQQDQSQGRLAQLVATFEGKARIQWNP